MNSLKKRNRLWILILAVGVIVLLHGLLISYLGRQKPHPAPSPGLTGLEVKPTVHSTKASPGSPGAHPSPSSSPERIDHYKPPQLTPRMKQVYGQVEQGKFDQAEKTARGILKTEPKNSRAMVAIGEIRERQGRLTESIKIYQAAHKIRPADPWPLERMAQNWLLLDRPDEALKSIAIIEKTGKLDKYKKAMKADAYLMMAARKKLDRDPRWQQAARHAGEIIVPLARENPQWEFQVLSANLHLLYGRRKQALVDYRSALESGAVTPQTRIDVLMALTLLNQETGQQAESQKYLNRLVAFMDDWKPRDFSRSLYLREYALLFQEVILDSDVAPGKINTHRRYYRNLYRDRLQLPQVEVDQTLYILSEMVDMEWEEGIESPLEEVNEYMSMAPGPKYPECFYNKMINRPMRYLIGYVRFGDVYRHFGKTGKALKYYRKALEISPDNPAVLKRIKMLK